MLIARAKPDEDFIVNGLISRFSNKTVLANYLQCISTFKNRIKEFYEPLKELVGAYNILFIEGEYTTNPKVLESHLCTRGLDTSLFDEIIDLDRTVKPVESYWREKIVDNLLVCLVIVISSLKLVLIMLTALNFLVRLLLTRWILVL